MDGILATDGATAVLGEIVVQNNTWGRGALANGRDFTQVARLGDWPGGPLRFEWAWPQTKDGVRAYPQVFAGRKPWGPETGGALLPLPLAEAAGVVADYAVDWGGETEGFNIAFDLWVSADPAAGAEAISHEIMVWLAPGGLTPAGRPAGRVAAGGLDGVLFTRRDHGEGWTYLAVISDAETAEGRLEVGALIAALQDGGHLPRDGWLMTVELGAEVTHGAGWLELRRFAVARAP